MIAKIRAPRKQALTSVDLPASKSLSNRALIIRALSGKKFEIGNLSEAEDTIILQRSLESNENMIDVGAAGTAMRFLTAYYAVAGEEKILTGTERMKQRPIAPLVDALKILGADIEYLEKTGCPPLKINRSILTADEVKVDGSISSQFLSALLMIAPTLPKGLKITINGNLVSKPYATMTTGLMKYFGVHVLWQGNKLVIPPQTYIPAVYNTEPDWSSAAFWYAVVALCYNSEISFKGLLKNSLQGDSILPQLMEEFGVETQFLKNEIVIRKSKSFKQLSTINIDFTNFPDLAQCITVLAAALDKEVRFSGIENLRIKETDRIAALQNELKKFGKEFVKEGDYYVLNGTFIASEQNIETYNDHRMVMAFAPLAICLGNISIENPGTVKKSYPEFWNDLKRFGFKVTNP